MKKYVRNFALVILIFSAMGMNSCSTCDQKEEGKWQKANRGQKEALYDSSHSEKATVFFTVGTKQYEMEKIDPTLVSKSMEVEPMLLTRDKAASTADKPASCTSNYFAGQDRKDPKTSIYRGNAVSYNTIDDLINNLPATDEEMKNHDPKITRAPNSERVTEEERYVTVKNAYIYGIYRENDNDFHCIVGNGETSGSKMKLLNVEISGLPDNTSADFTDMNDARNAIIQQFGDIACKSGAYKPVKELIPVSIEGSLFFDVDHPAGAVGFSSGGISYHPATAWEIHPVAKMTFQ